MRCLTTVSALGIATLAALAPAAQAAPAPVGGKAPYDAPPVASASKIDIVIDTRVAREILESLSRSRMDMSDVKVLEDLPPVREVIADSTRTAEAFEHDFAAAFQTEIQPAVFDFRSVRDKRQAWQALLEGMTARQPELIQLSERRAVSLLPADAAVSVKLRVDFSFALPGIEDDLIVREPDGPERMVIDFGRAMSDFEGGALDEQISGLSRVIAGEAFRQAWNAYREASPAWKRADPQLSQLEPLLKTVAAAGPVGLFTVNENFFPLAAWLKDPMRRAIDDFNRRAERFGQAQGTLEDRVELAAEIRRPDFARLVAGPTGGFMADVIAQTSGVEALRSALAQGPRAFFAAYDRATQKDKDLVPLAKSVKERLKGS